MKVLIIISLFLEIIALLVILSFYICKQLRIIKYEKENRKLAIAQIMQTFRIVCNDNDKLYAEICKLRQENKELKEKCPKK